MVLDNSFARYQNDMNTVALRNFSASEINIFLAICAQLRDQDLKEVTFDFNELRKISGYTSTDIKDFISSLDATYRKLLETNIRLGDDKVWTRFVLFNKYTINTIKKNITIGIQEEFKWVLNNLTSNFTTFELAEFVHLRSSYSKELYRRLKQYRNTGYFKMSIEDFRSQMDVPSWYRMSEIQRKILSLVEKELSKYFENLKIEKIKSKDTFHRVTHLEFTFTPEKQKILSFENSESAFELFWYEYPKKTGKSASKKIWDEMNLDEHKDAIMEGLSYWKKSYEWTKDKGHYVPQAKNFLEDERWINAKERAYSVPTKNVDEKAYNSSKNNVPLRDVELIKMLSEKSKEEDVKKLKNKETKKL